MNRQSSRSLGTEPAADRFFLCACTLVAAGLFAHAWFRAGVLDTSCTDGVMQSFNPLRRLAAGQTMGRDFDLFHGPGTVALQFLIWRLAGSTLHAVIFTRELLASGFFVLSFAAFARAVRFPWPSALLLALGVGTCLNRFGSLENFAGSSLLSIRMFLPLTAFFGIILFAWRYPAWFSPTRFAVLAGLAEGLAFFVSFEQGTAGAVAAAVMLAWWPEGPAASFRQRLAALGLYGVVLTVTGAACYLAACGKAAPNVLDFLVHDIPQDQFWYFGAPPNTGTESALAPFLQPKQFLSLVLFGSGFALLLYWRRRGRLADAPVWAAGSLLYTGIYALIGLVPALCFFSHYTSCLLRVTLMVWLFLIGLAWQQRARLPQPCLRLALLAEELGRSRRWRLGALLLTALALCAGEGAKWGNRWRESRQATVPSAAFQGVALDADWQQDLAFCDHIEAAHPRYASTYSGLIEARLGIFNPFSDYIIHALGRKRDFYVPALRAYDPQYFATLNPAYSIYEPWLEVSHWDLYRWLLRDYAVSRVTPMRIFWEKKPAPAFAATDPESAWVPLRIAGDRFDLTPPDDTALHLCELRVSYHIENPLHWLPLLGKVPRYLVVRENLVSEARLNPASFGVSLPPQRGQWVFPALIPGGHPGRFHLIATQTYGLGAHAVLDSVEARSTPLPDASRPALGLPW